MEDGWWSELRQITFFFMCGCLFMVVVPIAAYFLWMLKPRGRPKAASVLNAGDETTLPAVSLATVVGRATTMYTQLLKVKVICMCTKHVPL